MTTQSEKLPASVAVDAQELPAHEGISITPGSATAAILTAAPVNREERIFAIDVLRGFALLGILILNIVSFGLPAYAYLFPIVAGGSSGWNYAAWFTAFSLGEGKMRAMFSMMFGASVLLLVERLSRRGSSAEAADIHYRRMLWLRILRQAPEMAAVSDHAGDLDRAAGSQPRLATPLPFRTARMVLAFADLLQSPAHAAVRFLRQSRGISHWIGDCAAVFLKPTHADKTIFISACVGVRSAFVGVKSRENEPEHPAVLPPLRPGTERAAQINQFP